MPTCASRGVRRVLLIVPNAAVPKLFTVGLAK